MSRAGINYLGVIVLVAVFVSDTTAIENQKLGLIKLLSKPWLFTNHWIRTARDPHHAPLGLHHAVDFQIPYKTRLILKPKNEDDYDSPNNYDNDILRMTSEKRSAVATALNSGRRRREPASAVGKIVTPYLGVGVINDMGVFFDSLRDNLQVLTIPSPQQRVTMEDETPTVVNVPSTDTSDNGGGGDESIRRFYALRPLRPAGNIRSYNRRSFVEADGTYPGANHHDPALLWAGLGRR